MRSQPSPPFSCKDTLPVLLSISSCRTPPEDWAFLYRDPLPRHDAGRPSPCFSLHKIVLVLRRSSLACRFLGSYFTPKGQSSRSVAFVHCTFKRPGGVRSFSGFNPQRLLVLPSFPLKESEGITQTLFCGSQGRIIPLFFDFKIQQRILTAFFLFPFSPPVAKSRGNP